MGHDTRRTKLQMRLFSFLAVGRAVRPSLSLGPALRQLQLRRSWLLDLLILRSATSNSASNGILTTNEIDETVGDHLGLLCGVFRKIQPARPRCYLKQPEIEAHMCWANGVTR